jgi:hypothetical protein
VDVLLFMQKFDFCTHFLEFFDYKDEIKIRQIFFNTHKTISIENGIRIFFYPSGKFLVFFL